MLTVFQPGGTYSGLFIVHEFIQYSQQQHPAAPTHITQPTRRAAWSCAWLVREDNEVPFHKGKPALVAARHLGHGASQLLDLGLEKAALVLLGRPLGDHSLSSARAWLSVPLHQRQSSAVPAVSHSPGYPRVVRVAACPWSLVTLKFNRAEKCMFNAGAIPEPYLVALCHQVRLKSWIL